MAVKFNIEPYWDDFEKPTSIDGLSPKEKYNRILFRPGHALQARELTQMQSILSNQIAGISDNVFKDGAMVIPGHVSIYNKIDYIKLDTTSASNAAELVGKTFTNAAGDIRAKVVYAAEAEGADPITIFVNYTSGSSKFVAGSLIAEVGGLISAVVDGGLTHIGYGSLISIDDGIYYIKKNFVIVKSETIILDKYNSEITTDVGLKITEAIVGAAEDISLNDNAQETPNESAPGAHRYSIKTNLIKQAINSSTGNFVLLVRLENGVITKHVRTTDYSIIEDTMARRTFDESGNYTVNPFASYVKDHTTELTKLTLAIGPSKAYVRGYEIETLGTTSLNFNKAQDTALYTSSFTSLPLSNYIDLTSVTGIPDITDFSEVDLKTSCGITVGTLRVRSFENMGSGTYRVHVFDHPADISSIATLESTGFFTGTVSSYNLGLDSLVYKLPFSRIKTANSLEDGDPGYADGWNYRYETNRDMGTVSPDGSGEVTFNTISNEGFEGFDSSNWILEDADTGTLINLTSGMISLSGMSVTISGLGSYSNVKLMAPVSRTGNHKTKTLQTTTKTVSGFTTSTTLDHCDGLNLVSVVEDGIDVTNHFEFNNGQTATHYGQASLSLKATSTYTVVNDIVITYRYFDHVGSGDFFTVDSYPIGIASNQIAYQEIPDFNGKELRSSIDFRPRMNDANGDQFTGTGASLSNCPRPNTTFQTDIQYYLDRIDKVWIDKDGEFGVTEGVSSLAPQEPSSPKDAMVLYHLYIPAFTMNPDEVTIQYIDNRRYSMRDIGELENRISTLEYYTSLSLLEREADSKQILDDVTAIPRFKSGFLVDSFTSTIVGRTASEEYRAGINRDENSLRPLFNENNTPLVFDTAASGAEKHGDLVLLPITEHVALIEQRQFSGSINVNPFNVFNWSGTVKLTPSSDEWKDTDRRPQVIINEDGVFDAMKTIADQSISTGTIWNSWQTNWSGRSSTSSRRGRRIDTTTTTTTGQSRSGVLRTVSSEIVRTNVGDRVVEINFAPFIRSRIIRFEATRMRPNATVYAFLDGVDVSAYVREIATGAPASSQPATGINTITSHPDGATALSTDSNGYLLGELWLPNNNSINFTTGDKTFVLTDSSTNDDNDTNTFAVASYSARGLIETKENVVISTRVPRIQRTSVSESRVLSSSASSVRWVDPLAQSFMVDTNGGAFVTSLELFFDTKDADIPVQIQIREMDQGIPTQKIVPFSDTTINAASVNVDGTSTPFNFDSPVYLQDNIEYCFVILANSNEYKVNYAEIGQFDENGNMISKQPYNGVMFKSQNASTWTPDQNKDLMFVLNRAKFDISGSFDVILKNEVVPKRYLPVDPFTTTDNSNVVLVTHKNHGFTLGDKVVYEDAIEVNGIPSSEINDVSGFVVSDIERDTYKITTTSQATSTGIDGGSLIQAQENQAWNTVYPYVQSITLPNTAMYWKIRTTDANADGSYTLLPTYEPVIVNANYEAPTPKSILSETNSIDNAIDSSIFIKGIFSSNKDNLSPIIDTERSSVYTISNRINNPANTASAGYDVIEDYQDETHAVAGSALAKYVTKIVELEESSNQLKIFLDCNRPSYTDIEVYYKSSTLLEGFDDLNWVQINSAVPYSDDQLDFKEVEFTANPAAFTTFAIKIVFKSQSTSKIPSVKKLRAIALAV